MKCIVSGSLILSFLLALFPSAEALAAMAPMEERAGQKAAYYREIIMRDVPECTWDADTQTSHTTALYDPSGNVNGYIYEYVNGEEPAGFLQIDVSMGEPVLDSYTFGDEHCAARELRNLPVAISGETDTEKLVYLGGYAYCLLGETDEEGNTEVYDVLNHTETAFDRPAAVKAYEEDVAAKRQMRLAGTNHSKAYSNSIISNVIVENYSTKRLVTYSNVGDTNYNGCAALSGTNICMYWAADRGKSKLVQTMKSTFDELYVDMKSPSWLGTTSQYAYDGIKTYVARKGYIIPYTGTVGKNSFSFDWAMTQINRGRPISLPLFYQNAHHYVTIFGYQYGAGRRALVLADGKQSSLIYKDYSSLYYNGSIIQENNFAYYIGW